MISSLQNKRVKEALKLRRRKGRDAQHRFLIDGLREIQRAYEARVEFLEVFVCADLLNELGMALQAKMAERAAVLQVTQPIWEKLAYGNRRDGLLVVARQQTATLSELQPPTKEPLLILDGMEKPGNVGAMFRTAAAAGVAAVLLSDPVTDLFNPNAIRASLGCVFSVPAVIASAAEATHWLIENRVLTFVAHLAARQTAFAADLSQPCALVLGSEAEGVSTEWCREAFTKIRIPMQAGSVDSLNVANTGAVLLYEAFRQRCMATGE